MTGRTKDTLLIAGMICLIPLVVFVTVVASNLYRSIFNPYLDYDVARDVTISSDWVEITLERPLEAERQIQYLIIDITTPYKPDYQSWGLRLSDGSVVTPQIQLVDEQGNVYDLTHNALDEKSIGFSKRDPVSHAIDLPKGRKYPKVRIRCDKPIHCSRIYWHCYNQWDVS